LRAGRGSLKRLLAFPQPAPSLQDFSGLDVNCGVEVCFSGGWVRVCVLWQLPALQGCVLKYLSLAGIAERAEGLPSEGIRVHAAAVVVRIVLLSAHNCMQLQAWVRPVLPALEID